MKLAAGGVRMAEQQGPGNKPMTAQGAVIAVLCVIVAALWMTRGGKDDGPKKVPPLTPQEIAAEEARKAETTKRAAAEDAAAKERAFKGDVEVHAQMHVHDALIKARGDALPDKWHERGEMIRREGDFAMVLVRTGIKEGMLSPLHVIQSYLVSVQMHLPGDKVRLSAAQKCSDPPDDGLVAMMMLKNAWPSTTEALSTMQANIAKAEAKESRAKRRAE